MESSSSTSLLLRSPISQRRLKPGVNVTAQSWDKVAMPVRLAQLVPGPASAPKKLQQQQQQQVSQNQLSAATPPRPVRKASSGVRLAKPGTKRITKIPKLSFNSKRRGRQLISNQSYGLGGDGEEGSRQVNAGVYLLENTKTGHRYFGTTWDLHNAAAQNFYDLQRGAHPHHALSTCFQLYGEVASGIRFRILEHVAPPPSSLMPLAHHDHSKPKRRRIMNHSANNSGGDDSFDVRAMERKLAARLRFHQRKVVRRAAYKIVRQFLVIPVLERAWPRWVQATERCAFVERVAASADIQRATRGHLARNIVTSMRRDRAARILQRFLRRSHFTLSCRRRARVQRESGAARVIQRSMREFVARRKNRRRRQGVRQWLAARKLQANIRAHLARCAVRRMRLDIARTSAAIYMQRATRGHLARLQVHRLRQRIVDTQAATQIQKVWRGYSAREKVKLQRSLGGALTAHHWQDQYSLEELRDEAARTIQQTYHRWKKWCVEDQIAKATTIRVAYCNYVAKKFAWAAVTLLLRTTMINRIQRAARRWMFLQSLRRLIEQYRREIAALTIQCFTRQFQARQKAHVLRVEKQRVQAARQIQAFWRAYWLLLQLHECITARKQERSARKIQASYRGWKSRCEYLAIRDLARRNHAATKVQCMFRARQARREVMRRQVVRRMGACESCRSQLATVFHFTAKSELCAACCDEYNGDDEPGIEILDVHVYRRLQRLVVSAQRAYRAFQERRRHQFGVCTLCENQAVRRSCWECLQGRGARRISKKCDGKPLVGLTFCRSCDVLLHEQKQSSGASRLPHHARKDIERAYAENEAAVTVQKYYRRYAQRNTLAELQLGRRISAAMQIQACYRRHHQRRLTRTICAARRQQEYLESSSALTIQRSLRGYFARCELRRLKLERDSAIKIQRAVRQYQLLCRHKAAIIIQCQVRGWLARCEASIRRQERLERSRYAATCCIQRHIRGFLVRRRLLHARERAAAIVLQCAWRGFIARCKLFKLRLEKLHEFQEQLHERLCTIAAQIAETERIAATRIQTLVRRRQARDELYRRQLQAARRTREALRDSAVELENVSATCIQRHVRERITDVASCQRLRAQCCARCFLSRSIAKRKRLEKRSAVCIQRAFRYSRAKRRLAQLVVADGVEIAATTTSEWVELFDEVSGYVYYYHTGTGQSVWERPAEMDPLTGTPEESENVGEWVEYWDENVDASYFYNVKTGEATWTTPAGYQPQSSNQEDTADAWPLENGGTYYTLHPRSKLESSVPEYPQEQTEIGNQYYGQYRDEYDGGQAAEWGADAYTYGNNDDGQGSYYYYGDSAANGAAYSYSLKSAGYGVGEDVYEPVDTEYDINYKIYLTQIASERHDQQQQNDQQDQGEQDAKQDWTSNGTKDA